MNKIKYRKPEEMKDSGVEWLGKIPEEWNINKVKFISKCYPSNVDKKSKTGERVVKLCNYTDVYYNDYITDTIEFMIATATKEQIKKYGLCAGDIILTKDSESPDDIGVASYIKDVIKNLVCGYHLTLIKVLKENYSHYIYFQMLSNGVKNYFETVARGVTRYGIVIDGFKDLEVCIPEKTEQCKIANFLDIKTAQFDAIISKKELFIEKLEEAKRSLISEVVTGKVKIVDGQMVQRKPEEMKDSGIEWLGLIPKDWEKKRLKSLNTGGKYSFVDGPFGSDLKNEEYVSDGVPLIQLNNIKDGLHVFNKMNFITEKKYKSLIKHSAFPGEIVFAKMAEPVARCCIVSDKYNKYTIVADCIKFKPDLCLALPEFLVYSINDLYVRTQAEMVSSGTTRLRVNLTQLRNIIIYLPSIEEQKKIVEYLNVKNVEFINIVSKIKSQIQKLKEAKQSLISEAVTGKIDLRDWEVIEEGGA